MCAVGCKKKENDSTASYIRVAFGTKRNVMDDQVPCLLLFLHAIVVMLSDTKKVEKRSMKLFVIPEDVCI